MAVLLAMYPHPENLEQFDSYYWNTHIPLVKKMPGLRSLEVSKGQVNAMDGSDVYYLVAKLTWDSVEAMESSLNSVEGKLAAKDVANFAPDDTKVLVFDTVSV